MFSRFLRENGAQGNRLCIKRHRTVSNTFYLLCGSLSGSSCTTPLSRPLLHCQRPRRRRRPRPNCPCATSLYPCSPLHYLPYPPSANLPIPPCPRLCFFLRSLPFPATLARRRSMFRLCLGHSRTHGGYLSCLEPSSHSISRPLLGSPASAFNIPITASLGLPPF
jgi:hypothetical protein